MHGYGCDLGCFIARCFDDKAVTRLAERNRECVVKRNTLAIVVLVKFWIYCELINYNLSRNLSTKYIYDKYILYIMYN